jgi:predicted phage terminase large subunit-like protein
MNIAEPVTSKNQRMQKALLNPLSIIREVNNRSLYEFMQYFWDEITQDTFKPNWHIEYLCNELQQIAQRVAENKKREYDLIINIPPGSSKTITCSIMFPLWCWTKWFWMRFITASYSSALSLESAELARDIIRSEKFRAVYPELEIKDDKDTKSNYKIVKKVHDKEINGGNRYSTSVGGTLTGFHGHILIVDDPINPQQAVSETELNTANRWMEQTLSTRKTDKAVTPTIMIMQRLHQNDPSGHLLSKKKTNIKHISLPGEIQSYREQVKPQELIQYYENELLDIQRMNWDVLKDLEADLGQYGYSGQVGQNPVPPGGGMFKVDNFNVIDSIPSEYQQDQWIRYWDKAGSQDAGCYTVGVKMLRLRNNKIIVADVVRGQWSTETRERIIRQTAEADGRNVPVGIEQEPGSGGKESAENTIRNLIGYSCYADRPTGDKVFRADPYSVQVNNGNVWLLRGEWNHNYIEEHRFFPLGTYKDQVDASSAAFSKIVAKRTARMLT